MLLHDKSGNQVIWEKTAMNLRAKGYAVVTVDLRKHGKSIPEGAGEQKKLTASDYKLMALEDLEVVKGFLMKEHHEQRLNIRKLGIVAMGMSAPVALTFAANDWNKCRIPTARQWRLEHPRGRTYEQLFCFRPKHPYQV